MLSIAIQAGGESLRMGQNKALMPFNGRPLIERVAARVRPLADELLVTTNRPIDLAFLGLPLHMDVFPGRGALGGVYSALYYARHPLTAVIACDMPLVNPALLAYQCRLLEEQGVDVVIPTSPEGLEPFHTVYRRETCLPAILEALNSGKKRIISWFDQVRVLELPVADVVRLDPDFHSFINVNTPEEFTNAELIARHLG